MTCLDARQVAYPRHHPRLNLKGLTFEFKAFVLAYVTTFDQVLMLDADNFPLRNPDELFTVGSAELGNLFKQHGNLFWPDFGQKQGDSSVLLAKHLDIKAEAYTTFNLTLPWEGLTEPFLFTESGQMLFDRYTFADRPLSWYMVFCTKCCQVGVEQTLPRIAGAVASRLSAQCDGLGGLMSMCCMLNSCSNGAVGCMLGAQGLCHVNCHIM